MVVTAARNDDFTKIAFVISLTLHGLLFYVMIFGVHLSEEKESPRIIYSVTMESSNLLGGINQIPIGNQKTPIAPPKKTSAGGPKGSKGEGGGEKGAEPVKVEKPAEPTKKEAPKVETKKPEVADEDAEVSLADKNKKEEKKGEKKVEPKKEPPKEAEKKQAVAAPPKKTEEKPTKGAQGKTTGGNKTAGSTSGTGGGGGGGSGRGMSSADIDRGYQQAMQRYLGPSTDAGGYGFGGDGRGGSGMGGGVLRPPEWFIYKEQLETHVRKGWKWHQPASQLQAVVKFRISPSGVISDIKMSASSGNALFDQSVVRAVSKASPVPIPPQQFYDDFKYVEIDFNPAS